jgi:hypothetical protein
MGKRPHLRRSRQALHPNTEPACHRLILSHRDITKRTDAIFKAGDGPIPLCAFCPGSPVSPKGTPVPPRRAHSARGSLLGRPDQAEATSPPMIQNGSKVRFRAQSQVWRRLSASHSAAISRHRQAKSRYINRIAVSADKFAAACSHSAALRWHSSIRLSTFLDP